MEDLKKTRKNAISSHCHECMGYYVDGLQDCENTKCQFYAWMPYRKLEPDLSWTLYNPKRIGKVLMSDIVTKTLSEEHKEKMSVGLRRNKKEEIEGLE